MPDSADLAIWALSAAAIAAIIVRPWGIGEWIWACAGAAAMVVARLVPGSIAADGARDGIDVYLFLAGMIALAELAREAGVFDWIAGSLVPVSAGSAGRAFTGIFIAGIVVTALLSNDGTILLLTPAVLAFTQRARVPPLPMLYACAFVANAASFILPISNPANLVVFARLPSVGPWGAAFALPSLAALAATYAVLRALFRRELGEEFQSTVPGSRLSRAGAFSLWCVLLSSTVIVFAAGFGWPVGRVAFLLALVSLGIVATVRPPLVGRVVRTGHWSIVPLVAALFVIVQGLDRTGVLDYTRSFFRACTALPGPGGSLLAGLSVAVGDNVLNNLPAGVLVRYSLHGHGAAPQMAAAALVGIDLGPNLSLSGSLATILWLMTLRREGINVTGGQFLRVGICVAVPALLLALLSLR